MAKVKEQVSIQQLVQMYAEQKAQQEGKQITYVSHSQEFGNPDLLNIEITFKD